MGRKHAEIRAMTGYLHARARETEAGTARREIELAASRFDDMRTQRGRFIVVLERDRGLQEVRIFDYRRLLQTPGYGRDAQSDGRTK
jgi:hypothetical protein